MTKQTNSKKLQAITIGNAVVDTSIVSTTFNKHNLQEGYKHPVKNQFIGLGGGALNAAATLKKLNFAVFPTCPIGNDHHGSFITTEIKKKQIETTALVTKETNSHQSTIISIPNQEEPLIFSYKNKKLFLAPEDIPTKTAQTSSLLYIASFEPENIPAINTILSKVPSNCTVAFNPHPSIIENKTAQFDHFLERSNIIFMNQREAETYLEKKREPWNLHTFFKITCQRKPKTVVLTMGKNGVHVLHEGHLYSHPSLTQQPINTIGAGDAFGSCLAGLLVLGYDIKTAILYGLLNSKSVIKHHDTQTGILPLKELEKNITSLKNLSISPMRQSLIF